jgi:hypothetical protein
VTTARFLSIGLLCGQALSPLSASAQEAFSSTGGGEDYGAPLEHELWSMWSPQLDNARDFAHELGHLMGFGDDYAHGESLPGREGTLIISQPTSPPRSRSKVQPSQPAAASVHNNSTLHPMSG